MKDYDFSINTQLLPYGVKVKLNELAHKLFLYDKDIYYKKASKILNKTEKKLTKLFKRGRSL